MKREILLLVIGALISAFISVILWFAKRLINKKDKNNMNLHYLEDFYAPLYVQIKCKKIKTYANVMDFIDNTSKTHPHSIPEYFLTWKNSYELHPQNGSDSIKMNTDFMNHIETNYIWLRKKFKYDNVKVSKEKLHYLDCYVKKNYFADLLDYGIYTFLTILLGIGLFALTYNNHKVAYIFLSGAGFGALIALLKNYTKKWGS